MGLYEEFVCVEVCAGVIGGCSECALDDTTGVTSCDSCADNLDLSQDGTTCVSKLTNPHSPGSHVLMDSIFVKIKFTISNRIFNFLSVSLNMNKMKYNLVNIYYIVCIFLSLLYHLTFRIYQTQITL